MTKLSAVVARVDDVHVRNMRTINEEHKKSKQPAFYNGQVRTYEPHKDGAEHQLPEERTEIQVNARRQLDEVFRLFGQMWDIAGQRDKSNMRAQADVVVDGQTLLSEVPVPHLLYLEKQLNELRVFITDMPVRDPAEAWTHDPANELYRTEPIVSARTKKEPRVILRSPATEHHPQRDEIVTDDVVVGVYKTTKLSAALSAADKRELLGRITALLDALKVARVEANYVQADELASGAALLAYLWPGR